MRLVQSDVFLVGEQTRNAWGEELTPLVEVLEPGLMSVCRPGDGRLNGSILSTIDKGYSTTHWVYQDGTRCCTGMHCNSTLHTMRRLCVIGVLTECEKQDIRQSDRYIPCDFSSSMSHTRGE